MKKGDRQEILIPDKPPLKVEATIVDILDKGLYNMVIYKTDKGNIVCNNIPKINEELEEAQI